MKITFLGAAGCVTGSCHLIEVGKVKFLLDCGQFQGLEEHENEKLPIDARDIDFVILSHAHLDHCGRLPLLVKKGFKGPIFATSGTIDLAKLILMDAGQVQEETVKVLNRRRLREGLKPVSPLFVLDDAIETFDHFVPVKEGQWFDYKGVRFKFHSASHILCSESVEIEIDGKRVVYSADIGEGNRPFVKEMDYPPRADVALLETTYGSRDHRSLEESVRELELALRKTFDRGGVVLIPSFALERSQEMLYYLKKFHESGELGDFRVYLDSPLAISITRAFEKHRECYSEKYKRESLSFKGLKFVRSVEESMKLNQVKGNAVIIAGNGMCSGGRILHHIKHHIWDRNSSIIFVGYQAKGTLGRQIVEGARKIKVFNEIIKVNAEVYTINGFSSHAGKTALLKWAKTVSPSKLILVHGEQEERDSFSKLLEMSGFKGQVFKPSLYQSISV